MRKALILFLATLSVVFQSNAAHIIGGEVYYDYLGNDQYRITFEIYRDCNSFGAAFDNPLHFTAFHANNNTMYQDFTATPVIDTLPIVYDDPCVTPPNDICVERGIYEAVVTLPATAEGYYITYQRCCWTASIQNINIPDDWGITISTNIPGTNLVSVPNNSARFANYPPIVLCSGQTLDFDHYATDPDGDSLVYYMCTPETINTLDPGSPQPIPNNAAPYAGIPWDVGFSDVVPFGPGSNVTIDSQTGFMNITPNLTGLYVAAVCVEEWRNGVLINTKSRTFGYRVVTCEVTLPMQVDVLGAQTLIEDCGSAGFIVSRDDSTDAVDLQIFLSGTAMSGSDYNELPDTLVMPANVGTDTISITPYLDGLPEGDETIIFSIVVENPCEGTYDTTTAFITVQDYIEMTMTHTDSVNVCDETDDFAFVECEVQNGVPPYYYSWNPALTNDPQMAIPTSQLEPNLNLVYVGVFDQCGKQISSAPIKVYNQCPLGPPNVITADGDGINEFFIVQNLEDYDRVHLQIFNRWGNLVYEDEAYQNNWNGVDMNGNELVEGVYTYTVVPESIKFIYDDAEKSKYTAHGIVHIIRK